MKEVDIEAEKKEIERMIEECEATENQKDPEKELEFFTEDAVYQRRDGMYEKKQLESILREISHLASHRNM